MKKIAKEYMWFDFDGTEYLLQMRGNFEEQRKIFEISKELFAFWKNHHRFWSYITIYYRSNDFNKIKKIVKQLEKAKFLTEVKDIDKIKDKMVSDMVVRAI